VQLLLAPGKDPAQAERIVYEEVERVAREGLPKEEMKRIETDALRRRAFQLVTTTVRANLFAYDLTCFGQVDAVNEWEKKARRVGSDDVKRAALKYLTPAHRTVLTLAPGGKP
jgi:predicted Zn-dependent peptidase